MPDEDDFLYLQLAQRIESMISSGVYAIGEKLPSLRSLHREHNVSISTALQVYLHLERKGWVEAKEKSGYFVRFSHRLLPELPTVSTPAASPSHVKISEKVAAMMQHSQRAGIISLIGPAPHPSLLPVGRINKALRQAALEGKTSYIPYSDLAGHEPLRRHIARLSLNWRGTVSPDDILITNGAMEAAALCLRAVAKAGDTIAIESPTFFGLLQAIENLGMKALEIPTDPVTGISLEKLEDAFRRKKVTACLFVPNYNNPLGSCMPGQHKKELARLIEKYQVPLIEDDVYGELYFSPDRPSTIKSFDRADLVLYCSSFSKFIAPGLRVGWIISHRYRERLNELKFLSSVGTSLLTQLVINKYLDNQRPDLHLRLLRQQLSTQRMQLIQAVKEYFPAGTRLTRPDGGISIWVELPGKMDTWELYRRALEKQISFTPGGLFSSQHKYGNCLRLSYANPWNEDQDWALQMLGKLAKS
ncbi:MAG TPA: PLP-dependent aminotransferase family protein [Chitinophaga sp.]|uniref:aminotransferase-like domain-containing protein n=1 Tax=Chitinophaga sp. TaxID=1869181 RepID=UPI002C01231A|nr:PLP-dependent aminotransferase family protein [Chitinophaga sp.]HVI45609.1 PLP-dependent aminotransferase family protein [Chitinophaga sp.]